MVAAVAGKSNPTVVVAAALAAISSVSGTLVSRFWMAPLLGIERNISGWD